jgi:rhomboid protease GluP
MLSRLLISDNPQQFIDPHLYADRRREFMNRLNVKALAAPVTFALIGLNVLMFLTPLLAGGNPLHPTMAFLFRWGGNYGPKTVTGAQWWRLLTSIFIHEGIEHLTMNMLVLWQVGQFMERLLGSARFLIMYLVSAVAGGLVTIAWKPYGLHYGASGAVTGVCGALLGFLAMKHRAILSLTFSPLMMAALVLVAYVVTFGNTDPGVDIAGHLGGLAAGFVCGLVLAAPITNGTSQHRARWNVALLAGATILMPAVASRLRKPMIDCVAVEESAWAGDPQIVSDLNHLMQQARNNEITEQVYADRLENQIPPRWDAVRQKYNVIRRLPPNVRDVASAFMKYMDTGSEGYHLIAKGLRTHETAVVEAGMQTYRQARSQFQSSLTHYCPN